ncbi:hypothetical protein, partial [Latilactobacillus fuchuensis]
DKKGVGRIFLPTPESIDPEKGPQEKIKSRIGEMVDKTTDPKERFKLGDDIMIDYVMAAVDISDDISLEFDEEFVALEKNYLSNGQFKGELKGARILKNKNFTNGLVSLGSKETSYHIDVFRLFKKYNVKICIVTENKISAIVMGRLGEWIQTASVAVSNISFLELAYVLSKYISKESSQEVNKALENQDMNTYNVLKLIKKDLSSFIKGHQNITRMKSQLDAYRDVIKIINRSPNMVKKIDFNNVGKFNWKKVDYSLTLWLDERAAFGENNEYELFLDEGIKSNNFNSEYYKKVHENQVSADCVGIRCADLVATIIGKLISKLSLATAYEKDNPGKLKYLDKKWFEFKNDQLVLAKLIFEIIFNVGSQYSYINGTYFDDATECEAYIRYVSSFREYQELTIKKENSQIEEFKIFKGLADIKYQQMAMLGQLDVKTLMETGSLKPV